MEHTFSTLNGRITGPDTFHLGLVKPLIPSANLVKKKIEYARNRSNHWSSTEYNNNNAWNVNFQTGGFNNNNKYNGNSVRPCVASGVDYEKYIAGWVDALIDCCQRKKSTIQCSLYRTRYEQDLLLMANEVKNRTYKPSTSICFVVTRPKFREIFAANFRDRIAQHWIILRIEPLLEDRFVEQGNVSFNCRKNFGTKAAVERLDSNIKKVSCNYTKEAYIGKFDLKSFFMSTDKKVLLSLFIPFLREKYKGDDLEDLIWLSTVTILHEPQRNCIKKGILELWDYLPPDKSLFSSDHGIGMPIGNITSQLLANFYLSFLDEYMNKLCSRYGAEYIRFVDDFVIVCRSKSAIKKLGKKAGIYLKEKLNINLHPDKMYLQHVKKGVKFVGSVIMPNRIYISNRTVAGLVSALYTLDHLCCRVTQEMEKGFDCSFLLRNLQHYVTSVNSYMGFLVHTSSYAIRYKNFLKLGWFWNICEVDEKSKVVKIKKEYKLKNYYKNGKNRKK